MEIEIPEPGRMTQSGSSLLRLIQNNDTPILDLLVRESLQNSLDAALGFVKNVEVHYLTGKFDNVGFCKELNGISDRLHARYPQDQYDFLAIRDSNTCGLTGPMNYRSVRNNQYGNLMKLVYEISKPQEQEGAGGSWGLGKTVYFRIGIGMVLYYSRIRLEQGGYQSRLAVTLVEDESSADALLPKRQSMPSRGIAWWGRKTGENATEPLTDEVEIERILDEFGIPPYQHSETGTTVVIPYIKAEDLLNNNAIDYRDPEDREQKPFWRKSLEDYLRIAIQRWYTPRLNNVNYPYGKYLHAYINDKPISRDSMEPFFKVVLALYNRAIGKKEDDDVLTGNDRTGEIPIEVRAILDGNSVIGKVAYAQVSREELHMNPPDNKLSPYIYTNTENSQTEGNSPIICFTRKPGMIVNYVCNGAWADGIPQSDPDHYIVAIFVPDSSRKFRSDLKTRQAGITTEEYFRRCEKADHTSWKDWSESEFNPRLVSKIQLQIRKKISNVFNTQQDQTDKHRNSGLGKLFGDMLLPPQNFGKRPAPGNGKGGGDEEQPAGKHRSVSLHIVEGTIAYQQNTMDIQLKLRAGKHFRSAEIWLGVDSESGIISPHMWEKQMGLSMPFVISKATISYNTPKKEDYHENDQFLDNGAYESASGTVFSSEILKPEGDSVGIKVTGVGEHSLDAEISIQIDLKSRRELAAFYLGEVQEAEK